MKYGIVKGPSGQKAAQSSWENRIVQVPDHFTGKYYEQFDDVILMNDTRRRAEFRNLFTKFQQNCQRK